MTVTKYVIWTLIASMLVAGSAYADQRQDAHRAYFNNEVNETIIIKDDDRFVSAIPLTIKAKDGKDIANIVELAYSHPRKEMKMQRHEAVRLMQKANNYIGWLAKATLPPDASKDIADLTDLTQFTRLPPESRIPSSQLSSVEKRVLVNYFMSDVSNRPKTVQDAVRKERKSVRTHPRGFCPGIRQRANRGDGVSNREAHIRRSEGGPRRTQ